MTAVFKHLGRFRTTGYILGSNKIHRRRAVTEDKLDKIGDRSDWPILKTKVL